MEDTLIPWCDDTHNFWMGCTPVSAGCVNCYAREKMEHRFSKVKFGAGEARIRKLNFAGDILRMRKKPFVCKACSARVCSPMGLATGTPMCPQCGGAVRRRRVFTLSLGDLFDREVELAWLYDAMKVISESPELDFLVLTKRPECTRARLEALRVMAMGGLGHAADGEFLVWLQNWLMAHDTQGPGNVWLGVTGETAALLSGRWQGIAGPAGLPARQYFLSLEPLLEDVSGVLSAVLGEAVDRRLNVWVIPGGESGPDARPCRVDWVRSALKVSQAHGYPCFVKQLGRNPAVDVAGWQQFPCGTRFLGEGRFVPEGCCVALLAHPKGGEPKEWPTDLRVREEPFADVAHDDLLL